MSEKCNFAFLFDLCRHAPKYGHIIFLFNQPPLPEIQGDFDPPPPSCHRRFPLWGESGTFLEYPMI